MTDRLMKKATHTKRQNGKENEPWFSEFSRNSKRRNLEKKRRKSSSRFWMMNDYLTYGEYDD